MYIYGIMFLSKDIFAVKDGDRERFFKRSEDCAPTPNDIESMHFHKDYVAVNPGYVRFVEIKKNEEVRALLT